MCRLLLTPLHGGKGLVDVRLRRPRRRRELLPPPRLEQPRQVLRGWSAAEAKCERAAAIGVGNGRECTDRVHRQTVHRQSAQTDSAQTECTDRQRKAAAHLVPEHLLPDGGVLVAPRLSAGRTRGQRSAPGGATRQDRKGKGGGGGAAAADCAPAAAGIVAGTWDACTYVEWTKTSMPTLIRGAAKAQRRRSLPWGTGSQDGFKKRSRFQI